MGYISNFIVYTLAMVGVIVVALLVFKNATSFNSGKSSKYLKIIDSISLGQRKNLYIVSTGKEQFLIAGDVNNTCLISKLEGLNAGTGSENIKETLSVSPSFKDTLNSLPQKQDYIDKSYIGIRSSLLKEKSNGSVMRNLAEIMKQ